MTKIIVNEKIKGAKELLDFVKTLPYVEFIDNTEESFYIPNAVTQEAIKQAENGIKITETENVEDFFKKLNS